MVQTLEKKKIEEKIIQDALAEDLSELGDITTDSIVAIDLTAFYKLTVNENTMLAGFEIFKKTFLLLDENITIKSDFYDGDKIIKDSVVATIYGNTRNILKAERTALNFLCHLSGISTNTRLLVDKLCGIDVKLLDTRKTTPNLRYFEKQAILAGGASNHRLNLSDMVLIKDNHIASAGSVTNAIEKVRASLGHECKIEIEVKSIKELKEAVLLNPSIIMFDNWRIEELKNAIKLVPKSIFTEVSGQITPANIVDYAKCGVNSISTSYMVKNAKWIDFSLNESK